METATRRIEDEPHQPAGEPASIPDRRVGVATEVRNEIPLWACAIRTACCTVFAVSVLLFPVALTNLAGYRGGWAWASVLFGATGAAGGWWGWGQRGRLAAAAVLGSAGIALGLSMAGDAAYSYPRIKAEMNRIAVPEGFVAVDEKRHGFGGCIGSCPTLERRWMVAGTMGSVQERVTAALAASDFELGPWEPYFINGGYSDDQAEGRRGRLRFTAIATTTPAGGTPMVPENHLLVTFSLTS